MPKVKEKSWNTMWCCNPFGLERHSRQMGKRKVTENMRKKVPSLVIGDAICITCSIRIYKMQIKSDETDSEAPDSTEEERAGTSKRRSSEEEYIPDVPEDTVSVLNTILTPLGESPISKSKLSRVKSYSRRKSASVGRALNTSIFNVPVNKNDGDEMISQFKDKFASVNTAAEKYMILTCLPKSWSEHKISAEFGVSTYVAHTSKITQAQKGVMSSPDRNYQRNLPDDVVKLVKRFYEEDDISRVMPGMKDVKSIKEGGKKIRKQKRLLLSNLKELYREFKIRNPGTKIGFSRFATLRPKYCVMAGAAGTHNVCVCMICENTKLMFMSLNNLKHESDNSFTELNDLVHKIMCSDPLPECYLNKCAKCPTDIVLVETLTNLFQANLIEEVIYRKWKTTDRAQMTLIKTTPPNFIHNFIINLKKFKSHNFIAKAQSNYLRHLKTHIKLDEVIVIGDYSENYSFVIQDAIQGYHWSYSQATIHPFVIYYRTADGNLDSICFSIVSEYLVHDTAGFHLFQKKLIAYLKQQFPHLKKIFYFSDGAAAQYKNKKNFENLLHHEEDFDVQAEWHFFATSHGKGPCDGLGGTIKRLAARASIQGTMINTPIELYEWAKSNLSGIVFSFTSNGEHKNETDFLNSTRFVGLKTVPGTRNIHCVVPANGKIRIKTYSSSPETPREVEVQRMKLPARSRRRHATSSTVLQGGK